MITYVFGVDPGTTTGLAIAAFGPDRLTPPTAVWSRQLLWDEAANFVRLELEHLARMKDESTAAIAVGEKFTINAKTAQRGQQGAEDALGMLGVLRRECYVAGIQLAKSQQAQPAKKLVTDDALRNLKFFAPGATHINDAYRHVVLLAVSEKLLHPSYLLGEEQVS